MKRLHAIGFGSLNLDEFWEVGRDFLDRYELSPGCEYVKDLAWFNQVYPELESNFLLRGSDPGGSAANAVAALRKMGFRTGFYGVTGMADVEKLRLDDLGNADDLRITGSSVPAGRCLSMICSDDGERDRVLVILPNANDLAGSEGVDNEYFGSAQWVHFTSFVSLAPLQAQIRLIGQLSDQINVSFDPGFIYCKLGMAKLEPILHRTRVLFITEDEVEMLTGSAPDAGGASMLLETGVRMVVIKMGAKGIRFYSADGFIHQPAVAPRRIIDRTGAGDVAAAGFLAGLIRSFDVGKSLELAAWAASRSIEDYGRKSYPDKMIFEQAVFSDRRGGGKMKCTYGKPRDKWEDDMERIQRRVFVSDCEGPITKNDNAAELAEAFIPKGDKFFGRISLYDDYLAEVSRKPDYKAGDTLRLILPFFKAFGLDDRTMVKFSRRNIQIIPQADCMLRDVMDIMPAYIVSTSYSQYISAVCDVIGFPYRNTYSTFVDLDAFSLKEGEKKALRDLHARIIALPDFSIPPNAVSPDDLPDKDRKVVEELDEIFWKIIPTMEIGRIIDEVNPVGGKEKAAAILKIADIEGAELRDIFYVGDSITDVEAFRMLKSNGGMALSFNGNNWAVKEASFAVTARSAIPIGWLAMMFVNQGIAGFDDLMMTELKPGMSDAVSDLSCMVRKTVRTEKIGSLG